ncbi:Target of Myb protein [Parasponia andersonii]|uniref:Target of Myb protein n=1 Tax=Parasponia andersonii TaxID=3476 RepID=A0A2P5BDQ6_PARAD|nr:Target of Myb protein [Parasponia andersonii]
MDSSRRAVESYWRSRMIDGATSDEDKVTPVYKLEEICDLLRSSHVSIVKELSEFILKRLDHKSPIVKQKALRLIKYAVGKSGVEFRREMQRHSVAVRQLFHYKGQLDPLKGDALNKAVRDTAHETITAIFSEENRPAPAEDRNRRIQGFGNTNFEMPSEDKKSFLSEVVGIGSASIKQGLSSFTQSNSLRKNDNGSYKSPTLHRSLTRENEYTDKYEPVEYRNETQGSSGFSKNVAGGPWNQDSGLRQTEMTNGNSSSSHSESKMPEERLLETIVTSGGVRLQPTRDGIQIFLGEAAKLNALALSHALESKLQSPLWQVRMKAVCVLESILRRKDDEPFSVVGSYFSANKDVVMKCSESPQSSLREKANKVLSLLGGEQTGTTASISEKLVKAEAVSIVLMPDLIDTGDSDDFHGTYNSEEKQNDQIFSNLTTPASQLIDDLFGDNSSNVVGTTELKSDDDPFADVSFHTNESKEPVDDLFSGMTVDGKEGVIENHIAGMKNGPEVFDIFGSDSGILGQENHKKYVEDLMGGLSINESGTKMMQNGTSSGEVSQALFSDTKSHPSHQVSNNAMSGILGPQTAGMNANFMFPQGAIPPGFMFNQAFPPQQINYGAMGNLFAQQLATMSSFQHMGNLTAQNSGGVGTTGGYSSALPDIFQSKFPSPAANSTVNSSKKEETKAFDFISISVADMKRKDLTWYLRKTDVDYVVGSQRLERDHLQAARDPKRLI